MFVVALIEHAFEAFYVTDHGRFVLEARSPDEATVPEDPHTAHFFGN